jgi:hypothetical protein
VPDQSRPVIFLSGIGNELIRILQQTPPLNAFEFIIFCHGTTNGNSIGIGHFRTTLENLYINVSNMLPPKHLVSGFKNEVFKLSVVEKKLKIDQTEASKVINSFLSLSETDKTASASLLDIPVRIMEVHKESQDAFKNFRAKFCDIEQGLRYFLFSHLGTILKDMPFKAGGLLVLNIHSEMDPCKSAQMLCF